MQMICVLSLKMAKNVENTKRRAVSGKEKRMFEKFGELDSAEEINELAENLFNEGDMESIRALAEENGIPGGLVGLYLEGETPKLCDAMMAALGKIEKEEQELKPKEIMQDWVEYLKVQCMESNEIARQVRRKGKSMKGCIAALLVWSFGNQQPIDKDILKEAKVNAGRVTLGIPGMGQAKKIIREYYGGAE